MPPILRKKKFCYSCSMNNTDIRLATIPKFMAACDVSLFEAIILTGSMVFGKYHTVHRDSDVDVICVIDPYKVRSLMKDPLFSKIGINQDMINNFELKHIDRFWVDYFIDDIKINIGIWSRDFVDYFIEMRASEHILGSANSNLATVESCNAKGEPYKYQPLVKTSGSTYIKTYKLKYQGELINSPSYSNLIASSMLYDPGSIYQYKVDTLIKNLNIRYGTTWQKYFLSYIYAKGSPEYLDDMNARLSNLSH